MSGYTSGPHCSNIVLKLVLLLASVQTGYGDNGDVSYMVSASGSIYSGRSYGVVVGIFNSLVSCSCEVFLKGPSIDANIELYLTPNHPISSYTFELPELKSGRYFLIVKGLRGLNFENTTELSWHNYKNFIKIQTPKTHYRPGQILQFRIYFHNETMNSVYPEDKALIWIEDAKGSRVRVYRKFEVTQGIFQSELRLSQTLNPGRWRICAQNGPALPEECAYIKVMNFDFPAFSVVLTAPNEISLSDNQLLITVQANYSLGTPVKGRLNVQVQSSVDVAVEHQPLIMTFKKDLRDGLATFNVSVQEFKKKMIPDMPLMLTVVANVFENLTDKMVTVSRRLVLWGEKKTFEKRLVEIRTPHSKIKARQLRQNNISIDYGPKRMTQLITFRVNKTLSTAICVIMFNGLVLTGQQVFPVSNEFNINVTFTMKMWPIVHIFLFGMEAESNVLFVASQTVSVPRFGHEHTDLQAPSVVSPGEKITVGIHAQPRTYVCLSGVDIRAYDLQDWSNNDFTLDYFNVVKYEFRAYVSDKKFQYNIAPTKLGMIIMSNAATIVDMENNHRNNELAVNYSALSQMQSDEPALGSINQELNNIPDIGENMKDVWIYECLLITKPGWTNFTTRVPKTMASWRLNAFSINPTVGLTLQGHVPFIKVTSIKPVFTYIRLPKTIKTGEIIRIALKCFNLLGKTLDVTIRITQNLHQFELLDTQHKPYPNDEYVEQEITLPKDGLRVDNIYLRAIKPCILYLNLVTIAENVEDRIVRQLQVLPDVPMALHQQATYVTLSTLNPYLEFQLNFPHEKAQHGLSCYVSSNIIAQNLQSISPIAPQDTCEQLISKLMSIYYLWDYGNNKEWLTQQWKEFLKGQLIDGFQSIMRLRGRDGGFTYIAKKGNSSDASCGSTWLTAYALRLFQLLMKVPVNFDRRLLIQCEKFLLNRRQKGDQFTELCETPGRRKLDTLELSIEVFKVLQQSTRMLNLQESHRWLSRQLQISRDYHLEAKRSLNILDWKKPEETVKANWRVHQRNLETAGHILILHLERRHTPQQADIAHWLMNQMYGEDTDLHCYESSVAERAIYEYLKRQPSHPTEMEITTSLNSTAKEHKITINKDNQWTAQPLIFGAYYQTVNFVAEGTGEVLVHCSYDYEVKLTDRLYKLKASKLASKMLYRPLHRLEFCAERNSKDLEYYVGTELELKLPTGYELDMGSVQRLAASKYVRQAIPVSRNTKLFLTLVKLEPERSICIIVLARSVLMVQNLQNGTLSVSDINTVEQIEVLSYQINVDNLAED